MQPAIGAELPHHGFKVVERVLAPPQSDFQLGGLHRELHLPERVGDFPGQGLVAGKGLGGLILFRQCGGDLFLDAEIIGEEGLEAAPDLDGLVVLLSALVDASQGLEDLQEVVALRLPLQGPFEGGGGLIGLADQDQGLAQVVRRHGVIRTYALGLPQRRDRRGILPALGFEEPEDQPGGAVPGILGEPVTERLEELIERTASTW